MPTRFAVITVGEKLDLSFVVKVWHDGVLHEMPLAELLTGPTVISVYMKNNTGRCDRQNDSLVAQVSAIEQAGFNVIGLSRDTSGSHARYAKKKQITYPLVSDPGDQFAQAARSVVVKSRYGRNFLGPARAAFLLNVDATVLAVVDDVDSHDHAGQLLTLIAQKPWLVSRKTP